MTPGTRFERVVKTRRFRVFRCFRVLLHTVFSHILAVLWDIAPSFRVLGLFPRSATPGTRFEHGVKTRCFRIFWAFSWGIAHSFRVTGRFPLFVTPRTRFECDVETHRFRIFWSFLWAIAHSFMVPGRFPLSATPATRFERIVQTRCFRIIWRFCVLLHSGWGSGPICTVRAPRYTI